MHCRGVKITKAVKAVKETKTVKVTKTTKFVKIGKNLNNQAFKHAKYYSNILWFPFSNSTPN